MFDKTILLILNNIKNVNGHFKLKLWKNHKNCFVESAFTDDYELNESEQNESRKFFPIVEF